MASCRSPSWIRGLTKHLRVESKTTEVVDYLGNHSGFFRRVKSCDPFFLHERGTRISVWPSE
jgi:hypothetical protein